MRAALSLDANVNVPQFTKALRKVAALTNQELHKFINRKMFFVTVEAKKQTPVVSRAQIEQELGVKGYRLEYGKRGGILARSKKQRGYNAVTNSTSLVHLIINARRGEAKQKGLYGGAMRTAVGKFLAKRFRSVGTLRGGWQGALRTLGRAVGLSGYNGGASIKTGVRGRSTVKLARPGWNPTATVVYNTNSFDKDHRPYIDARLGRAMANGFSKETANMNRHLASDLAKTYRRNGVKVNAVSEIQRVMRGGV